MRNLPSATAFTVSDLQLQKRSAQTRIDELLITRGLQIQTAAHRLIAIKFAELVGLRRFGSQPAAGKILGRLKVKRLS